MSATLYKPWATVVVQQPPFLLGITSMLVVQVIVKSSVNLSSSGQNICGNYNMKYKYKRERKLEGCLTVHLPHEIIWNANLMQQGNFIDVSSRTDF